MPKVHKSLEVFLHKPAPVEVDRTDIEQALGLLGFALNSHKGSHYRWSHPNGTRITYALKGGRKVGVATVKEVAKEIRKQGLGE